MSKEEKNIGHIDALPRERCMSRPSYELFSGGWYLNLTFSALEIWEGINISFDFPNPLDTAPRSTPTWVTPITYTDQLGYSIEDGIGQIHRPDPGNSIIYIKRPCDGHPSI